MLIKVVYLFNFIAARMNGTIDPENIEKNVLNKPRTRKGKKILEAREPKTVEGPRQTLFMKGTKTSERIQGVLKNFVPIRPSTCH